MKRLIAINVLTAAILFNPLTVLAESTASSPAALRKQVQQQQTVGRQAKLEQKIASNAARLEKKLENKEQMIASKEAMLANRLEQVRTKIASREAAFTEKIAKFKNRERADLASKINLNLNLINQNRTTAMSNNITKMSEILTRLQNKVTEIGATGVDVSVANTAIQQAQTAIASAQASVTTQSEQDYNIVVTSETNIGTDAQTTRNKLITDLNATFQQVQAARTAVANAISVSVSLIGGQNGTN